MSDTKHTPIMKPTTAIETEFEIVPASLGLEIEAKNSLELAFSDPFTKAREWLAKADAITDPKEARAARLEIVKVRTGGDKIREKLKKDVLVMGRAIDGAFNVLVGMCHPIESRLDAIEKKAEREEEARIQALADARAEKLREFEYYAVGVNLGTLSDAAFDTLLADAKDLLQIRKDREAKAEAERIAKEMEEAEEKARVAAENARLKKEAEEREAAMKAEREANEAARLKAEKEAQAEREKAAKEREQIEAKAKAERDAIEAKAKAEREKAAKERDARLKAEAEAQKIRNEEVKREQDAAAARSKAARAPEKEKVMTFARSVRALTVGELKTPEGKAVAAEIEKKIEGFAKWIEAQAATL